MIYKKFIKDKIGLVRMYYGHLEIITGVSFEKIKKDFIRYYACERVFQLIVDEITDINSHIISRNDFETPDDFQSSFMILSENKVLSEDFAKRIAPVVGLRNRLVHRYEKIDKEQVLKMIYKEKEDFKKYCLLIEKYLEKKEK